jgi:hypothetical protein
MEGCAISPDGFAVRHRHPLRAANDNDFIAVPPAGASSKRQGRVTRRPRAARVMALPNSTEIL